MAQHGTAAIMSQVAAAGMQNVYIGALPPDIELPIVFGDLARIIKDQTEALVIGIRPAAGGKDALNPADDREVKPGDRLIYLSEHPVLPEKS